MKFAICNEMFEGWEFSRVCEAARNAGYTGVELAPYTLGKPVTEVSANERRAIRTAARAAGVEIACTHWLLAQTSGLHISGPDPAVRQRTIDYLVALIRLTGDIGAITMVFGSPKQRCVGEGRSAEEAWKLAADTFSALIPSLAEQGITFCLEPLSPDETDFLTTAAEAARMIRHLNSPHIRLILDVKAMSAEAKPIPDIIRENAPILGHFHANDTNLRGPGFGNTDFRPIAAALEDIRYQGWISVEVFDFRPDPVTIAAKSMEYLRCAFS